MARRNKVGELGRRVGLDEIWNGGRDTVGFRCLVAMRRDMVAEGQGSGSKVVMGHGVARQGGDVVGEGRDGRRRREFGLKGGP